MTEISVLSGLIHIFETVGFPVAVTFVLLIRYEMRMERLEKQSRELSDTIDKLRRDMP